MSNKKHVLQDSFLNTLRQERVPVAIFLSNGVRLQGRIHSFDQFSILLCTCNNEASKEKFITGQLVYKHAILTIMPSRAIKFCMADAEHISIEEEA